ncbi:DUF4149 domain-containing protein [Candidatus Pelagibacter communis]|uniref:DUF4149 domain-containing protein n=1 Tax=Candidatus Pelagibacter TaxID=198251 RepID=UPI003EE19E2C
MILNLSNFLASGILAIMLFFSFTIAPKIFKSLDEKNARSFIRNIFPYYYSVNLILSVLVIICFIILNYYGLNFYLISFVAILFAFSQFILMPMINKFRDNNETKKFNYSHAISVIINIIQMVFLVIILI